MAFDEGVAERLREALANTADVSERKMFGGLAFMVRGNMCCGIIGDILMVRVGLAAYDRVLGKPYVRPMDFTGRPMRGLVFVEPPGFSEDLAISQWVHQALQCVHALPPKNMAIT